MNIIYRKMITTFSFLKYRKFNKKNEKTPPKISKIISAISIEFKLTILLKGITCSANRQHLRIRGPPRLSWVDRIRRDGRRPPVCSLCGVSVRFRAPPVPESEKGCATARLFSDHSLRFESCQVSQINS